MTPNPFDVQTPENLTTDDMLDLFVQTDSDYLQVEKAGHTFISGPRGAGKSMYFRFLEPDCQCVQHDVPINKLKFYAAYIPIKETDLNLPELFRLEELKHASIVMNEHFLILHIATKIFVSLLERAKFQQADGKLAAELKAFYDKSLVNLVSRSGGQSQITNLLTDKSVAETLNVIISTFDNISSALTDYTKRIAFSKTIIPYDGPLLGFSDFLVPMVKELMNLSFMPSGPLFLLIDDADNLNETQASILNSWVARRTTGYLCFKISVQEGEYKTYKAVSGQRIEAPHDYSEFNISDKYTTRISNYVDRVTEIVQRRLDKFNIKSSPQEFFPTYRLQEERISELQEELKANWELSKKSYRPNDDATRYARPDYIKQLSEGQSKSGSVYSYSGFGQLVHLSSGIVRHLLEMSSLMFAEECARLNGENPKSIPHTIQNEKARYYSEKLLFEEFRKLEQEEANEDKPSDDPRKLKNLIEALGGMFRTILTSKASERRVFSIAFSDKPDEEVSRILRLGVKYGYFHRSSIGNKEGTGRCELYIMTRALAPSFKLDPTSFAGYKFVTNDKIKAALYQPKRLLSMVKIQGFDTAMSDTQGVLFDGE